MRDYKHFETWYKRVAWFGIFLNMLFVIPCFFFPAWILGLLDLEFEPMIWAQAAGMLLFIISVFYIPAILDLKKYRANAWIAIIPSRMCGFSFFFISVFFLGAPVGFIPISMVDLLILCPQALILLNINRIERGEQPFSRAINISVIVALFLFIGATIKAALQMI